MEEGNGFDHGSPLGFSGTLRTREDGRVLWDNAVSMSQSHISKLPDHSSLNTFLRLWWRGERWKKGS